MLSKKYRFHGHGSLNYLFRNGKGERSAIFGLRYTENLCRPRMRVAVIISKKVFKSAVKRNRARRRTFEILRELLPETTRYDLAITIFSPEIIDATHNELKKQLTDLLKKAKII